MFAFRLAAQLGRPVGELLAGMSAAEFGLWRAYYRGNGFDADRAEWASANAGAACAGAFGARVRAAELVPRFGPRRPADPRRLQAWLDGLERDAERMLSAWPAARRSGPPPSS